MCEWFLYFTVLERTESISKIKGATKGSVRLMRSGSIVELDEGRVM
jgi:Ca2+/H+ antiporter